MYLCIDTIDIYIYIYISIHKYIHMIHNVYNIISSFHYTHFMINPYKFFFTCITSTHKQLRANNKNTDAQHE